MCSNSNGKDRVVGSIPAEGPTPNQQLRPGLAPGLLHVEPLGQADHNRLPGSCHRTALRSPQLDDYTREPPETLVEVMR